MHLFCLNYKAQNSILHLNFYDDSVEKWEKAMFSQFKPEN